MAKNAVVGALRVAMGLDSAQFERGLKSVSNLANKFGVQLTLNLETVTEKIGQAIGAFPKAIFEASARIEEMRKLSAQLDQALANTGNTAQTSAAEVEDYADALERTTGRAAEEVMAVATNLATFGFGREVFYEAIALADDMSAAWGGDLKQNIEGLSRALADPEKGLAMLTKRGITFTAEQQKMIAGFMKTNDLASAQRVIFDALNEQVQGVAAAGFGGLTKATANVRKAIEDFFEVIAINLGANTAFERVLGAVASMLDRLGAKMAGASSAGGAFEGVTNAITGALGLLERGIVLVFDNLGFLFDLFKLFVAAKIITFIAGLVGTFITLAKTIRIAGIAMAIVTSITKVKITAILLLGAAIAKLTGTYDGLVKWVEGVGKALANALPEGLKQGIDDLSGSIFGLGEQIEGADGAASKSLATYLRVQEGAEGAFGSIGTGASAAGAAVAQTTGKVGGLADAFAGVREVMSEVIDDVKTGFASVGSSIVKALVTTKDVGTAALDAVGSALDSLASKVLDMAFNGIFDMILGAFTGGMMPGGKWNIPTSFVPGGFFPGLATGGRTMTDGLVEVGERGKELLRLPKGAQVIRHSDISDAVGGGERPVIVNAPIDARGAQMGVAEQIDHWARMKLPGLVRRAVDDPYAVGG
ncbi:MAG: hypothetical protein EOP24_27670 [Hyphomicrobiales bacterium]|nr:MAG: hypothetical protein EOP24_27670 [Hyphomicrobiales bacterium]